MSSCVG